MNQVLVSGSIAYDRIMNYSGEFKNDFHPEKLHALSVSFLINQLQESRGGTGGNIAYNLRLLEEQPILLACAGNDFGKYAEQFQKMGIDTSSVQIEADEPSAVAHVITDVDGNQITAFYMGAMSRQYSKDIPSAALAIVAPSNPKEMVSLPDVYRSRSIPFFYDPGQQILALTKEDFQKALPGAAVVFGNDYEIDMVLRKAEWTMKDLLNHVSAVVTTLGALGSVINTADKEIRIPAVPTTKLVDPTGGGDAYRAGFAKAWLKRMPLETCAKLASAVAVYAVESQGGQAHTFTKEEMLTRYAAAYGETLTI